MADHKDKKQELNELINEVGLLTRTAELLDKERKNLHEQLIKLEEDKGIVGYFSNQDNLGIVENFEKENEMNRDKLTDCIAQLNNEISRIKADLQPMIKELKPLRSEQQNSKRNFDEIKSKYDSIATNLDIKLTNLEEEVKELEQKSGDLESNISKLDSEIEKMNSKKKWIEDNGEERTM